MGKKIAIIYPTKFVDTVPCLVSLVHFLIENNYEIDIFHSGRLLNIKNPKIKEYSLREPQNGTIVWKINFLFNWLPRILLKSIENNYSIFIGVDPYGLIISGILGKALQTPYVFFSLELLFCDEIRSKYIKLLKRLEIFFNKAASFTLIQDIERAELLRKENQLPRSANILLVPNSSTGGTIGKKSHYLRSKFDISSEQVIILYSGTISPEFMVLELVKMAASWEERYALILHSGRGINYDDEYVKEVLKFIDWKTVFLDTTFMYGNEYDDFVSGADIGLAFYKAKSKNIFYMGLSSGKVSRYLKCRLPIITTDSTTLRNLIDEYKCGVVIKDLSELGGSIKIILEDYTFYSQNAATCFLEKFYLSDNRLREVLDRINSSSLNFNRVKRISQKERKVF